MRLEIRDLLQKYGNNVALKGLSYDFLPGVYGILGANGAGKSTLMNLITDNVARTTGQIEYDGTEILQLGADYRKELGYMPQQQEMYEQFSARMFLMYMAHLKGIKKKEAKVQIDKLLSTVNLSEVADRKIESFSGGMKQRVLLAQALLGDPKVLILDEPTAGLDPKERISIRNYIYELSKDKIILYATHVVSDIECIADQVLIMNRGELVVHGTPTELIEGMYEHVAERVCSKEELIQLQSQYPVHNLFQTRRGLVMRIVGDSFPEGFRRATGELTLEDVYLYYVEYKSRI